MNYAKNMKEIFRSAGNVLLCQLFLLGSFGVATAALAHQPNDLCGVDPVGCTYGFRNLKKAEPAPAVEATPSDENTATATNDIALTGTDTKPTEEKPDVEETTSKTSKSSSARTENENKNSPNNPVSSLPEPSQEAMRIGLYPLLELIPPLYPGMDKPANTPTTDTISAPEIVPERTGMQTAKLYLKLGFQHILPLGIDHILFVLALFLASTRMKPLLLQVTAFTLAHTLTLGLAMLGWVSLPSAIVEPLIALSIAFVAIENYFFKGMTAWRPFVVFGFGLFHGLGFASVLTELGLPNHQFVNALLSFNVGVELGQLTVIAMALLPSLLIQKILRMKKSAHLYRAIVVIPFSIAIAAMGLFWAFQRIFLEN